MTPLYTQQEFDSCKYHELLPLQCKHCAQTFFRLKNRIKHHDPSAKFDFCSRKCHAENKRTKVTLKCDFCKNDFQKFPNKIVKSKFHFCSKSCSAKYGGLHKRNLSKSPGNARSKLELYIETNLKLLYPNLDLLFNSRKILSGLELDIYIESLNLGIEINGILHYEPIYGVNRLNQVQNSDKSKSRLCHDLKIDLCVINTSDHTYVSAKTCHKYLEIIKEVIDKRL